MRSMLCYRLPSCGTGGDVSFFVIKRDTKMGIRMKDKKNPAFLHFKGIDLFPISSDWVKAATYHAFDVRVRFGFVVPPLLIVLFFFHRNRNRWT
jgi:hypothetical protein